MSSGPRLLREVISIPEAVHKGDLVFRLGDAAADTERTVAEYVVTDQLVGAFRAMVDLVGSAIEEGVSKAAYLDGSFGSGKSNFMGMLQLLLDRDPHARAKPKLAPVVAAIDEKVGERRILTVPFHLIGSDDLESAVLGGYVRHLAEVHPDAPPPAVYADEPLLANADDIRARVGDEKFFADLSQGIGDDDGWGDLGAAWTADTYEAARHAPEGSEDRTRLVQALLTSWLSSFAAGAEANRSGYVGFEDGLAAISVHAQSLGYGGVILFLDELILWFLSRLGDTAWVNREASKLSKLVEATTSDRPVPIVSIIARQRDLRELVGTAVPGAERLGFADQLAYQEGRFDRVPLDDTNLPVVAHERLLKPVDDAAAGVLADAFAALSLSPKVRDALLSDAGSDDTFRLTYPFSPAFMTVLVDVAGALQRTRTGLRVLLDLLVARRDVLEVGQLVPVGDLYDVIDSSDDPFSDAMRSAFDQARKIYRTRLRPAVLASHDLAEGDEPTGPFLADDRLVKTLLLAALVPESVPFKDLTVERLVALNHGTISSPIPGQETSIVLNKLKGWAAQAGELRLGSDPHNPTVSVVLEAVDAEAILESAAGVDNTANRRTLVKQLVLGALGLPSDQLTTTFPMVWKGIRREVSVTFGNLRDPAEIPDATFHNDGAGWKLLIDFPFDDAGHTPLEDVERIERFRHGGASWSTLTWVPAFFTASTLEVLGRLVRLNHVLANDNRFAQATAGMNATSRAAAKSTLRAMQEAVRSKLDHSLSSAYGLVSADARVIDPSHPLADHFPSLRAGLKVQPPTSPEWRTALEQVLGQALAHVYPGAPDLESEVKAADIRKVAELCAEAVIEPDGRLLVADRSDRRLLTAIANPLKLGLQSEQAFKLQEVSDHWDTTFTRAINQARAAGQTPTVGALRVAINTPDATGLSAPLENLIIRVWAQATNHTFREHGGPVTATVDRLDDRWEVVPQPLPSADDWEVACERLASVFGVTLPTRQRTAFALERAGVELARLIDEHHSATDALLDRLRGDALPVTIDPGADRIRTAACAQALLGAIGDADDDLGRVEALVAAEVAPSDLALGRSIKGASELVALIDATETPIIAGALSRPEGAGLRTDLEAALAADEFVTPLAPVLARVRDEAVRILAAAGGGGGGATTAVAGATVAPAEPGAAAGGAVPPAGPRVRQWSGSLGDASARLDVLAAEVAAGEVDADSVEVTLTWRTSGEGGG